MPGVIRSGGLKGDIASLQAKYPSLDDDIRYLENLLRTGRPPSTRCGEFVPEWVWRIEVHISAFKGGAAEDRCTLVYERDGPECYLWLVFDNDTRTYASVVTEVGERRGSG